MSILSIIFKPVINNARGKYVEHFVNNKLDGLDEENYKILSNIMLPSGGNTTTTQIDHIVVSNYGIFCIETKAHRGWIFGSKYNDYWTQVIYKKKTKFYNPLKQNFAHKKAIEKLIGDKYPNISVISLVAFPSADKLKISGTDCVGCARDIVNKIKNYSVYLLSNESRDDIYNILYNANIQDRNIMRDHKREVRELK